MRGDRPPLPHQCSLSDDVAAEQLLSAEAMLCAHPALEGAKCTHVEALILCRKYDAALKACTTNLLPASLNTIYLKAEAQWRGGSPANALETLHAAGVGEGAACKCGQLATFLKRLVVRVPTKFVQTFAHAILYCWQAMLAAGEAAGDAESASTAYGKVLATEAVTGTHLQVCASSFTRPRIQNACSLQLDQAFVLRRRAELHEKRGDYPAALADLDASIALHAGDVDAHLQRAGVHRQASDFERCFLDTRTARILDPQVVAASTRFFRACADASVQRPGAFQAEQAAAQAAVRHGSRVRNGAQQGPASGTDSCNLPRSYQVLGVGLSATQRDFTRQYRKLASKWHPDKWATATAEGQKLAEHRFRVIAEAYETLRDPELRAKHDRDFFFTSRS